MSATVISETSCIATSNATSRGVKRKPVDEYKLDEVPKNVLADVSAQSSPVKPIMSIDMIRSLAELTSFISLPKARRFVFCEFFYSPVDYQLFCGENEFLSIVRESMPNLRTKVLRRCEWRQIRRLIGKPRRFSQTFLTDERRSLNIKREKVANVYKGLVTSSEIVSDLPSNLPRPLRVGTQVFVRIRNSPDTIATGTISAIQIEGPSDGYHVVFDSSVYPSLLVPEYEVMTTAPQEVLPINYFLSANKASNQTFGNHQTSSAVVRRVNQHHNAVVQAASSSQLPNGVPHRILETPISIAGGMPQMKDENVGNFPVRMLVIIVKMCKLMEYKRTTLRQFRYLTDEMIQYTKYGKVFPRELTDLHAEVVVDLEVINKMFKVYSDALNEYRTSLVTQRSRPALTDRPDTLRRNCNNHAGQILKQYGSKWDNRDPVVQGFVIQLTSLILQVRYIGQFAFSTRSCSDSVQIIKDSVKDIRQKLPPKVRTDFEKHVEAHIQQIISTILKVRSPSTSV